jgi:hypothetical protein
MLGINWMNAAIFYVSYKRDFDWFTYSIRTLEKFGSGFSSVTVAVPNQDLSVFQKFCEAHKIRLRGYIEVPGKSFICHMLQKCMADVWCPRESDVIVHLDSDNIFQEKFSLDTYLHDGLPILMREHFDDFRQYPSRYGWKWVTDYALRDDIQWETMCRHPSIHWKDLYRVMRDRVEEMHGIPFEQYMVFQKDSFPQSVCEFCLLGTTAIRNNFGPGQWNEAKDGWPALNGRYRFVDSVITPGPYWADPKWEILGLPPADKIRSAPAPLLADGRGSGAIGEYWAKEGWSPICLWHLPGGTVENRPYPANPMRYYWSKFGTEKFRAELDALIA